MKRATKRSKNIEKIIRRLNRKASPNLLKGRRSITKVFSRASKQSGQRCARLVVSYSGLDGDIDNRIRKAGGARANAGSGAGAGGRDINFRFSTAKGLERAVSNVRRLRGIHGLRAKVWPCG